MRGPNPGNRSGHRSPGSLQLPLGTMRFAPLALLALILVGCGDLEESAAASAVAALRPGHPAAVQPLALTSAARAGHAALPRADVVMALVDYDFVLSREITPGRQTIRVRNQGRQPHQLLIGRLAPGKSLADALARVKGGAGPLPFLTLTHTASLEVGGEESRLTVDFEPGEYVLLCLLPDAKDGKPHLAHGMARQIRVIGSVVREGHAPPARLAGNPLLQEELR